ncbi:zinc finger protein 862-like [Argopecten irradians]|uniref:zinc finger protein 862-like n=1 Tax=Argopecten irradians TaxID=31199 RepID=UPI003718D833
MWKYLGNVAPPCKKKKTDEEVLASQRIYDQKQRVRKFQPTWQKTFTWLEYDPDIGMFCTLCKTEKTSTGSFITGCQNMRLETVKSHDNSESHRKIVLAKKAQTIPTHQTEGVRVVSMMHKSTLAKLSILFRNAHAIGKNGRPFTDYTKMCQLDQAKGLDIGNTYLNDKSCQAFIAAIADTQRKTQCTQVNDARFISIISDGSTDSSSKEAEILYLRTSVKCKVSTFFVGIRNVPRGDAVTISSALIQLLNDRFGESWKEKLIGAGTDGAAVMTGKKSGVVKKVSDYTGKPVMAIHCSAHRLELSYKDAVKESKMQQKCDALLLNLYLFYKYSPLNRANLRASFNSLGQTVLVPTRVGGTRWLPHTKRALHNVLTGYSGIVQHLEQLQSPCSVKKEASAKARNFLKLLKDPKCIYWMHLSMDVVTCLSRVSEVIQHRNGTLADVCIELDTTKACLLKYVQR